MKIDKITIKNYRNFGSSGIEIEFSGALDVIIGKNNIGKSAIIKAILALKDALADKYENKKTDWHFDEGPPDILLELTLAPEDFSSVLTKIGIPTNLIDKFKKEVGNSMKIHLRNSHVFVAIGSLFFYKEYYSVFEIDDPSKMEEVRDIPIAKVFDQIGDDDISGKIKEFCATTGQGKIWLRGLKLAINYLISELLMKRLVAFSEFRGLPQSHDELVESDTSGKYLSHFLHSRNISEEREDRDAYQKIQEGLRNLINMTPASVGIGKNANIVFEINHKQVPLQNVGSGVFELLNLIAYLKSDNNIIILIDEPELHLHPHMQRILKEKFAQIVKNNQIIIVSHSPIFVDVDNIHNNILLREEKAGVVANKISADYFDDKISHVLKRYLENEKLAELFFCDRALLIEGWHEYLSLLIFAKRSYYSLNLKWISVICVSCHLNFKPYLKLLEGFQIPWSILCDKKAVIPEKIEKNKSELLNHALIKQLLNLQILPKENMDEIIKLEKSGQWSIEHRIFGAVKKLLKNKNCYVLDCEDICDFYKNVPTADSDRLNKKDTEHIIELAENIPIGEIPQAMSDLLSDLFGPK